MGALYIMGALVLAGIASEGIATLLGIKQAGGYDYHFASGVGAVFGTRHYN